MKLSASPNSKYYNAALLKCADVHLNGEKVEGVIYADEEGGVIIVVEQLGLSDNLASFHVDRVVAREGTVFIKFHEDVDIGSIKRFLDDTGQQA